MPAKTKPDSFGSVENFDLLTRLLLNAISNSMASKGERVRSGDYQTASRLDQLDEIPTPERVEILRVRLQRFEQFVLQSVQSFCVQPMCA